MDLFEQDVAPSALVEFFSRHGRAVQARRGQIVIAAGSRTDEVYLVSSGIAQITSYSAEGKETIFRELGGGHIFGEFAAICGTSRSVYVLAKTDLRLTCLPSAKFLLGVEELRGVGLWLSRRLAQEVQRLSSKLVEMATLPIATRLQCELLRMCHHSSIEQDTAVIDEFPTHNELAARIGARREAVTRELGALGEMQLFSTDRRSATVHSLTKLAALVEHRAELAPGSALAGITADASPG